MPPKPYDNWGQQLYLLKIYVSIKQNEYTRMIDILSVRYFGLINSVLLYRVA